MVNIGWVDVALLTVVGLSVLVGLVRGFVYELLSLVGWVAAYTAAQWLTPMIAPHMPVSTPGSPLNTAASFAAVFVLALIVWSLAAKLIRLLIRATPLSIPDRLLGAVFGAARALVLLVAATTLVLMTPAARSPDWRGSQGGQWLTVVLAETKSLLPPEISKHIPL